MRQLTRRGVEDVCSGKDGFQEGVVTLCIISVTVQVSSYELRRILKFRIARQNYACFHKVAFVNNSVVVNVAGKHKSYFASLSLINVDTPISKTRVIYFLGINIPMPTYALSAGAGINSAIIKLLFS